MNEEWRGTWYDVYLNTPEEERRYYVYIWFERQGSDLIPFYVGKGTGSRYYNTSNRSKSLQEYIKTEMS